MMELIIKPVDVWLFRDGRPFSAGEDHDAATIFPPTPFTLQGAIRTKVLVDKGVDFTQFKSLDLDVGYGDKFGKLRLIGPMLARKRQDKWERLIPVPVDLMEVRVEDDMKRIEERFILLKPKTDLSFKTNLPERLQLLWAEVKSELLSKLKDLNWRLEEAKGWLPESEWARYLQGEAPKQVVNNDSLFALEPRFGIAIDRSKRITQTQMLYRATFVRLRYGVALWAKVEGVNLQSKEGFLRFGGEGRSAIYEAVEPLPSLASYMPKLEKQSGVVRFKVVLISPAWFSGGWQPKDGDWSKIFGAPVRLIAAAIPRAQKFGGFDMARNEPKPIRNFVSAGSVYFFEANELPKLDENFAFTETPDEVRQQNNGKNAWANIGFGKVLIGRW
ncbi:MAG: type III-B CRISPR module-associated protein Cmr3 [Archaeoglobaceae archaeon]